MPFFTPRFTATLSLLALSSAAFAEPADLSYDVYWATAPLKAAAAVEELDLATMAAADPSLTFIEGQGDAPDAMSMLSDVLFEFGRSDLAPEALNTLAGVAKKLDGVEGLQIVGHTDSIGTEATNLHIGMARAESVRDWFLAQGYMSDSAIEVDSMGEAQPIADNVTADGFDNVEGRALNRRVEFRIVKKSADVLSVVAAPHPTVF
ncbi:MAG: OmpA family protein [Pseudomonadota bacterium]